MGTAFAHREPRLSDGVVTLRRWDAADTACVEAVSGDPYITLITTVPAEYSQDEGLQFVERQRSRLVSGEGISLAIALARADRACGCLTMMHRSIPPTGSVGIGYWVAPAERGRGVARRAVTLAADWALQRPGIARIEALVEPVNIASQRVVEAAGFEREGLLRSYAILGDRRADMYIYSRLPVCRQPSP
jgi:RimJ/RimL family protein N-acetyltransferase